MASKVLIAKGSPWMIPDGGPRCQRVQFPAEWPVVKSGELERDGVTLCYKNCLGNTVRTVIDEPQAREIYAALKDCFDG